MPILAYVNPKGGAGKSTSALVLATQLSLQTDVTLIDADPNRTVKLWAAPQKNLGRLTVVDGATEDNLLNMIDDAVKKTPFVILDMEGTASRLVGLAVSHADLTIIPVQGSQPDAAMAGKALNLIKQSEQTIRRGNPTFTLRYTVLMTRTPLVARSRTLRSVEENFIDADMPMLDTELNERDAFKAMLSYACPLESLTDKEAPNVPKAIDNARQYAMEVVEILKSPDRLIVRAAERKEQLALKRKADQAKAVAKQASALN